MARSSSARRLVVGNFLTSLDFDGANSTVVIPHNANQLMTSGFTISAWINPRSKGETAGRIVDKSTATTAAGGFNFATDNSANNRLVCQVDAGSSVQSANNSITFGRWQHVLVTVASNATVTFYVNGAASGTPATTGALAGITTTNALTIGNRSTATDRTFDGKIDQVRIWNRVLTATEIAELYNGHIAASSGLIGEYLFNEGAGTTARDTSASANNGTITSGTYSADVPFSLRKVVNGDLVKNGGFENAPPFTAVTTVTDRWVDGTNGGSTTNNIFGWKLASTSLSPTVTSISARYTTVSGRNCIQVVSVGAMRKSGATVTGLGVFNTAYTGATLLEADRSNLIPVLPNTNYIVSENYFTSQIDAGITAVVTAVEYDGTLTRIATNTGNGASDVSTVWRAVSRVFTTSATTRYVAVSGRIQAGGGVDFDNGNATVAFDDISLLPVFPEQRNGVNGNLVKNPDFELAPVFVAATTTQGRWIDGTAAGSTTNATHKWKCQSGANATAVQFDPTVSHSGTYSIKLSATDVTGSFYVDVGTGIASSQPVATVRAFGIPITGGTSYTLTGWVKTNNVPTNGAFLQFTTYDGDAQRINNVGSTVKLTGTNDWTQITITTTVGAAAVWATVGLMKNVAGNISDAWFDDIVLTKTTPEARLAS